MCLLTGAGGRLGDALLRTHGSRMRFVAVYRTRLPSVPTQLATAFDPLDPSAAALGADRAAPAYAVQADLSEPGAIRRVVEVALARFDRIDHVVNAAADTAFYGSTLEAAHLAEQLGAQLLVNALAPVLLAAEVARAFWREHPDENRAQRRSVLNVSSISGINVYRGTGQGGYSASKAALQFLSCHMAADYDPIGVRVNALAPDRFPGSIETETVADAAGTLLDGEATGKIYLVDAAGLRSLN